VKANDIIGSKLTFIGIAIIPESLIAVLTITMAVGLKTMAKRKCLVRKLDALESLGGVNIICSDKTGTLTQGKMITRKAWIPDTGIYSVEESGQASDPTSGYVKFEALASPSVESESLEKAPSQKTPEVNQGLESFLQSCALCSTATIRFDEEKKQWKATGDATEIALQVFSHRFDHGKKTLVANGWEQLAEYPFDSDVKRMSVVYVNPKSGAQHIYTKGAVERVIDLCETIGVGDDVKRLTPELKEEALEQMTSFTSQGLVSFHFYDIQAFTNIHVACVSNCLPNF